MVKHRYYSNACLGRLVFDVVDVSMRQMLNPELTASWEKGLSYVAEGSITSEEYMQKLERFIVNRINGVKQITNPGQSVQDLSR